jgi:hypothetical protein
MISCPYSVLCIIRGRPDSPDAASPTGRHPLERCGQEDSRSWIVASMVSFRAAFRVHPNVMGPHPQWMRTGVAGNHGLFRGRAVESVGYLIGGTAVVAAKRRAGLAVSSWARAAKAGRD